MEQSLILENVLKVLYKIDTMPRVFSLHSNSLKTVPYLYCHMDLYLPSDKYGMSVHIKVVGSLMSFIISFYYSPIQKLLQKLSLIFVFAQEMELSGSYQNCTEDFLQFGRDVLFITTHLRYFLLF